MWRQVMQLSMGVHLGLSADTGDVTEPLPEHPTQKHCQLQWVAVCAGSVYHTPSNWLWRSVIPSATTVTWDSTCWRMTRVFRQRLCRFPITKYSHVCSCTKSQRVTSASTSHNPMKLRYVLSYFTTRDSALICCIGWELPHCTEVGTFSSGFELLLVPVGI